MLLMHVVANYICIEYLSLWVFFRIKKFLLFFNSTFLTSIRTIASAKWNFNRENDL